MGLYCAERGELPFWFSILTLYENDNLPQSYNRLNLDEMNRFAVWLFRLSYGEPASHVCLIHGRRLQARKPIDRVQSGLHRAESQYLSFGLLLAIEHATYLRA
jgi:hypothetical protein